MIALHGPRATLRTLRADDEKPLLAGVRASADLHAQWVSAPADSESFGKHLARVSDSFVSLVLERREDAALAGVFTFSQIFMGGFCSAYLGFYALAPHAGQGLMTEGLSLTLRAAFEALGLHRVEANIQPDNPRSIALVKRCGFEREGFSPGYLFIAGAWRDHERWAMRRERWQSLLRD